MKLIAYRDASFRGTAEEESRQLAAILPRVDSLHLRGPESESESRLRQLVEALPREAYRKLWLHDHFEIAEEFGLGGIHISRKALLNDKALGIYAAVHGLDASISCHNLGQAAKLDELYDRVFICPLFEPISKSTEKGIFDRDRLKEFLSGDRQAEFIALGGISLETLDRVRELGFDGAAVLGALWESDDPAAYIKSMHDRCREAENTY